MLNDVNADSMPNLPAAPRLLLLILGWLCFGLGVIGMFVPLLPTTIFWILAVWCWLRSSPALAARVYGHPTFGPAVRAFIERGEMSRRAKLFAVTGMSVGFLLWWLLSAPAPVWLLAVGLSLAAVAVWLSRRPEPR